MKQYFWLSLFCLIGCAPSLEEEWEWDNKDETVFDDIDVDSGDELQTTFRSQVDATNHDDWVLLNLETGEMSSTSDMSNHNDWDIAIRRFVFALNCPLNGPENVAAQIITGDSYDDYVDIPTEGFVQDIADNNDDGVPEYVFGDWFDYDPNTHILTPKDQFYVIQNRNEYHFKFQIEDYYSSAGTSAMITISWEALDPMDTTAQQ